MEYVAAYQYDPQSNDRLDSRMESSNGLSALANNIDYSYKCTSSCFPDGGCCGTKVTIKVNADAVDLRGYSLRSQTKLSDDRVAVVLGQGDSSRSGDENELIILDSNP